MLPEVAATGKLTTNIAPPIISTKNAALCRDAATGVKYQVPFRIYLSALSCAAASGGPSRRGGQVRPQVEDNPVPSTLSFDFVFAQMGEYNTNCYYCEHEPMDNNEVAILARTASG